jgi:peptidoglycan/xylan/chitin deacetylase (PgdA/CDA1 family)
VADALPFLEVEGEADEVRAVTLVDHDVVLPGGLGQSGIAGGDADVYKLLRDEFDAQMNELARVVRHPPVTADALLADSLDDQVVLSFDDGGVSAYDTTAGILEAHGWRGTFFVVTDWIGRPGFLEAQQIQSLRDRGHAIGSHSCSHPARFSRLSAAEMRDEWERSAAELARILGAPPLAASVPCGDYSREVGEAASSAGYKLLFNSEPLIRVRDIDGFLVAGRFSVQRGSAPVTAAALAARRWLPRSRQWAYWNFNKALKKTGGAAWLKLRKRILDR